MTFCELAALVSACDAIEIMTVIDDPHPPTSCAMDDLGCKLAAWLLLADRLAGVVVPSREEWIGLNLLERDGEL
jgi:hypothetical protein